MLEQYLSVCRAYASIALILEMTWEQRRLKRYFVSVIRSDSRYLNKSICAAGICVCAWTWAQRRAAAKAVCIAPRVTSAPSAPHCRSTQPVASPCWVSILQYFSEINTTLNFLYVKIDRTAKTDCYKIITFTTISKHWSTIESYAYKQYLVYFNLFKYRNSC